MMDRIYVAWKKEQHSVDHPEIDQQHMKILETLNTLYQTVQRHEGATDFHLLFKELEDYVEDHFRLEERLMEAGGFPELSAHKMAHRKYAKKVQQLKAQYEKTFGDVFMDVFAFLRDWWLNHIQTADRKYMPFVSTARTY